MKHLIFVYGTLKRGEQKSFALDGQRFIGICATAASYKIYQYSGYPALIRDEINGTGIWGELYEVTDSCVIELDKLVQSNLFVRKEILLSGDIHLSALPSDQSVTNNLFVEKKANSYVFLNAEKILKAKDCGINWTRNS